MYIFLKGIVTIVEKWEKQASKKDSIFLGPTWPGGIRHRTMILKLLSLPLIVNVSLNVIASVVEKKKVSFIVLK